MNALKKSLGRMRRRAVAERTLSKYKDAGLDRPFLLVDTPEHGNIGDHAIALAEQRLLDKWFGENSYFEVTADQIDGFEDAFANLSPMNQVILVHGGGFLGALWPNEEYRFRRILKAFSDHKVVVFPQTVTFDLATDEGRAIFEDSARAYQAHPDLTVCCRERKSLQLLRESFPGVRAELVPDVVLSLDLPRPSVERDCVLLCMRGDKERALGDDQAAVLADAVKRAHPQALVKTIDTVVPRQITPSRRKQEVMGKLLEFSRARLVVTDRLHGMVFAAITETPCVALNNSNGKVEAVYEWISDMPYITFVKSIDDAVAAIESRELVSMRFPYERYLSMLEPVGQWIDEFHRSDDATLQREDGFTVR